MHCAGCATNVERAAMAVQGVAGASVNFATKRARIFAGAGVVDVGALREAVVRALGSAGYPVSRAADEARPSPPRGEVARLVVAAALGIPELVLGMSHGALWPEQVRHTAAPGWVEFALTTPIILWCGLPIARMGLAALRHGRANMHTLVTVGVWTAYVASCVSLVRPEWLGATAASAHAPLFFEAAAIITLFVLLGRFLEGRALRHTGDAVQALAELTPPTALVIRDGAESEVPVDAVRVGDHLLVRPGGRVPVDGTVVDGNAALDESFLTGEPMPRDVGHGSGVRAGAIVRGGALRIQATATNEHSTVAHIMRAVEEAQGTKAPVQRLVDAVASWFTPGVIVVAVAAAALWWWARPEDPSIALVTFVNVLVIACPCALGLATPTAVSVGVGAAARMGILFRGADVFERARSIGILVMDKTGTLTVGRPDVTRVQPLRDDMDESRLLALAAAAEARSEHPLAGAVLRAAAARGVGVPDAAGFAAHAGGGVEAHVDGAAVLVGSAAFLRSRGVAVDDAMPGDAAGASVLWVALDGAPAGLLLVTDTIHGDAPAALRELRDMGVEVVMATGDRPAAARAVGATLGIGRVFAEATPERKRAIVQELQATRQRVGFVGDGVNDAPAIAQADLSMAMGAGTDAAQAGAHILLLRDGVLAAADAVSVSRRTMRTIRENLVWALAYNAACIPLAAGLWTVMWGTPFPPAFAGAAMAFSSVSVVLNSLRLGRSIGARPAPPVV